jgi:hypothetical protein
VHSQDDPPADANSVDGIVRDEAIRAKVASVVQLTANEREGFWRRLSSNSLVNLVVGFLLTGLIGSWLTTCYQSAADANRRQAELREVRRSERLLTLDTVGTLLNEGYYIYGIYYDAMFRGDRTTLRLRRSAFERFNERLEKREILDAAHLCAHFGRQASDMYIQILESFHGLNPRLRRYAGNLGKDTLLGTALYDLRDDLSRLTTFLAVQGTSPSPDTAGVECRVPPPPPSGFGKGSLY